MARGGSKTAQTKARTEQERARLYLARTEWHESKITRRTRDNVIAGAVGGLLVIGCFISQGAHANYLANLPEPEPTPTVTPTPEPTPSETPTPEPTPEPDDTETPDDEGEEG